MHVLHACDNPACVRPSHLFLGDNVDNIRDRVAKGRSPTGEHSPIRMHPSSYPVGERTYNAKLCAEQVRAIRAAWRAGGVTLPQLAARYGVTPGAIDGVVRSRTWKHID
jgi:hypothetical protein